jgi:hypothetical protein
MLTPLEWLAVVAMFCIVGVQWACDWRGGE